MNLDLLVVFPPTLIEALGLTLLHALWQGGLVAAVLYVLLKVLHHHSAHTRYWLSYGALLTIGALSLLTFGWLYDSGASRAVPYSLAEQVTLPVAGPDAMLPWILLTLGFYGQTFVAWAFQYVPYLVAFWALGVGLLGIRCYGGWLQVRRLRRVDVQPVAEPWETRLAQLQKRMGVRQKVQPLQTPHLRGPVVVGFLRPVILLPLGCLAGLPTAQLEGILLHELAHVRRQDYLQNLLQTLIETIFFYHPAVWWMSAQIRAERENCCDDLAVACSGDTLTYATALLTLSEYTMKKNTFAMSLHNGSLLGRIKRLVQPDPRPGFPDARPVSLLLLLALSCVSVGAIAQWQTPQPGTAPVPVAAPTPQTPSPNLNEPVQVLLPAQLPPPTANPMVRAVPAPSPRPNPQPQVMVKAVPAPVVQDTTKTLRLRQQAKGEVPPAPPAPPAPPVPPTTADAPAAPPPPPPPINPADPPLLYIDGKEVSYSKFQELKPEEIESVEVLKEESAVQAYGEKGRQGVIKVTKKK